MYPNMCAPQTAESPDDEYRRVMAMIGRRQEDYTAFRRFLDLAGIEHRPGLYAAWCDAHREAVA